MRSKLLARIAVGALAAGVLSARSAQAVVVNVGGQDWDVTTFSGSYNTDTAKFNTANNGGEMPWWNNQSLAFDFASAVDMVNPLSWIPSNYPYSPYFAWQWTDQAEFGYPSGCGYYDLGQPLVLTCFVDAFASGYSNYGVVRFPYNLDSQIRTYAKATLFQSAAVPAHLPLLGVGAAFGFSRKLRNRIKKTGNSASSTFTL